MKKIGQSVLLLIMLFIPGIIRAENISENSLNRLMSVSGINKQIEKYPAIIWTGYKKATQNGTKISEAESKKINRSIDDAFAASEILHAIRADIKNNISESEARDLIAWYESDLGRKITKAEEYATTTNAYNEIRKNAKVLLSDEKRVKIAQKIDHLTNASDLAMQLQTRTTQAIFIAAATAINPNLLIRLEPLMAKISSQEQQIRENTKQFIVLSFLYSYKDLDESEMEKYMAFFERPNTIKFNNSIKNSMTLALDSSVDKLLNSLDDMF